MAHFRSPELAKALGRPPPPRRGWAHVTLAPGLDLPGQVLGHVPWL